MVPFRPFQIIVYITISCLYLVLGNRAISQQLVLPGDNPDPSVIKIGKYYWASSTTSNWLPAFPLLKSKDLIHWKTQGYVFPNPPAWADYYFWAPELSYDNGKMYVYYAAHKKGGNLCIGVASALKPEGPYTDLGPIECQEDGSIDAFPIRDEKGKLYLVWKEDANSINRPTTIWASEMREDRTALIGGETPLFNNTEKWEGNLVEGVSILKHNKYFYAFYAGSGCCGITCTYAVGIARSKNLLGPWEKCQKNPIMTNSNKWVCPGHGTPVEKNGRFYFLHHAYDSKTIPFTGRQGILSEFRFTADNWIEFIHENGTNQETRKHKLTDSFNQNKLSNNWQSGIFQNVDYKINKGVLVLKALQAPGAYLGQKVTSGNFEANVEVVTKGNTAETGLGLIGDDENLISVLFLNNSIKVYERKSKKERLVIEKRLTNPNRIFLRLNIRMARQISFSYSTDGEDYKAINDSMLDAAFLPPWDRAVRVGVIARGKDGNLGLLKNFTLEDK